MHGFDARAQGHMSCAKVLRHRIPYLNFSLMAAVFPRPPSYAVVRNMHACMQCVSPSSSSKVINWSPLLCVRVTSGRMDGEMRERGWPLKKAPGLRRRRHNQCRRRRPQKALRLPPCVCCMDDRRGKESLAKEREREGGREGERAEEENLALVMYLRRRLIKRLSRT